MAEPSKRLQDARKAVTDHVDAVAPDMEWARELVRRLEELEDAAVDDAQPPTGAAKE